MSIVTAPVKPSLALPVSPLADAVARASIMPLTLAQYERMIKGGIVEDGAPLELLCGVIVHKDRSSPGGDPMSHGPEHAIVVALLTGLAVKVNGPSQHLRIQLPVACPPHGAPEPDASIVRGAPRDYSRQLPGSADVSCVIEVADSSLDRDREDKLPIYAGAAIPQYVIVNLVNDAVEVYTDPDPGAEQYSTKVTRRRGEDLSLQMPEGTLVIPVVDVLP